jgi:selenide,water dikinase
MHVLHQLPELPRNPKVLVGTATADDAGVYRLDGKRALVQTVDFFTPIVDDPFTYGQIAAANALSDVYAMGGRPLTALNLLGVPTDVVSTAVIAAILRGGLATAQRAKCAILGGHTIRNPEPIYGLAVTGLVAPNRIITNAKARPGDLLVLTKPLGSGIVSTGIKRNLTSPALARWAVAIMRGLNSAGAELAARGWVAAGTDVTGFGFLGHLMAICRASQVGAEVYAEALPVLGRGVWELVDQDCIPGGSRQNLKTAEAFTDWGQASPAQKYLLTDAQTSGGLLLCVPPRRLKQVRRLLVRRGAPCAAVVGRLTRQPVEEVRIVKEGAPSRH